MKKLILLIIIIHFNITAYNQIITGTVLDKKSNEKICFANIYFNGTFVGTSSDIDGNFKLDVSENISMPLTISSIGYYSVTLTDFSTDKPLIIYLEPKAIEMKEVVVSVKSLVRKRKANLRLFRKIFLGTTENSMDCRIMNENDITFNYDSDRDTLKAFASKPIQIDNNALGYKITYYLDKFEYDRKNGAFNYKGNIIFNEDLSAKNPNRELYELRRKSTYLGSRMHFFRSLWADELDSNGFEVRYTENKNLKYNDIVFQTIDNLQDSLLTKKFIAYPASLNIQYGKNSSTIIFLKPLVYFNENGYSDTGIIWEGEMAKKRIGDALPFEYVPKD